VGILFYALRALDNVLKISSTMIRILMGSCFCQLHWEGWVRFLALNTVAIIFYALYGQYHADPDLSVSQDSSQYDRAPTVDDEGLNVSNS
jgi:hypothetical protein